MVILKVFSQHTLDFIYAEYGFGDVSKDCYVAKIESFAELAEIL